MWKLTVVAEASPAIICVASSTCFRSIYTVEFAAIAVVVCNATELSVSVNVVLTLMYLLQQYLIVP